MINFQAFLLLSFSPLGLVAEFTSHWPPEHAALNIAPPSYSETPEELWGELDREYSEMGLQRRALGNAHSSCAGGTCDFTCGRSNHENQVRTHPGYYYPGLNGNYAETNDVQPLSANWEPVLESIGDCTGLDRSQYAEFPVMVVLDKSWIDFYNSHTQDFVRQGYNSLQDSPNVLFDRVNYLFQQQFGITFKIGRVEAFPDLIDVCKTNNHHAESGSVPESRAKYWLQRAGITDVTGVEGGIIRLGADSIDNVYCHSSAPGNGICSGASTVDGLHQMINHVKPFSDTGGKLNNRASVTLAHEIAHWMGICFSEGADCINGHTDNHIFDIMVWDGTPAHEVRPAEGMMFKFLTTCTDVYSTSLCGKAKSSLASGCAAAISSDGDSLPEPTNLPDPTKELFVMTGSGCTKSESNSCVSSLNYPSPYGNQEECYITLLTDVELTVNSNFNVEKNYDYLTYSKEAPTFESIHMWKASDIPKTMKKDEGITWRTDGSVTKTGWKICFARSNSEVTTAPETTTTTESPTSAPTASPTDAKSSCNNVYHSDSQCNAWKAYCPGGTIPGYENWMQTNCCKACSAVATTRPETTRPETTTTLPSARSYTMSSGRFVRWNSCDQHYHNCGSGTSYEACVQQGTNECNSDSDCIAFSVRKRINGGFDDVVLYDGERSCLAENTYSDSHWDHFLLDNVEQAVGDDAEVVCTLPDPEEVDGYQYFYPNMLGGCTSKNCDNPTIMGPFSCTASSKFFGTGLAQMNGCTAENPQVTFSGCEEVLLWNILANPSAFVIHGLAILGLFSTFAFVAQRILQILHKGKYQAISEV